MDCDNASLTEIDACRICFSNDNTNTNPLLAPCKCIGSVKFSHLSCLKAWLNQSKLSQLSPRVHSYKWNNFGCEICKIKYPCNILSLFE